MNFMDKIPEDERGTVNAVILNESLNTEEKLDCLKDLITDADVFISISNFLHGNIEETTEELEPSVDDFLNLVSEPKKRLMSKMMEKKHYAALERMIQREKDDVQKAFQKWKAYTEESCPGFFDVKPATLVVNDSHASGTDDVSDSNDAETNENGDKTVPDSQLEDEQLEDEECDDETDDDDY